MRSQMILKRYIGYFCLCAALLLCCLCTACKDSDPNFENNFKEEGKELDFSIEICGYPTRGIEDESKHYFNVGELIHIRAEFDCSRMGENKTLVTYGVMQYAGYGQWKAWDEAHSMYWPDDAVTANFTAYYLHDSNGALSGNTMQPKLLSDYKYGEDPLYGEAKEVSYGSSVRLEMQHIFAHLSLTEMNNDISDELWFAVLAKESGEEDFNNAFYLEFDEETKVMTPIFTSLPSTLYKDDSGQGLVFITGEPEPYDGDNGEVMTRVNYFLEPRVYHKFALLYPRSRTEHAVYLSYNRDLVHTTGAEGFVSNGRYEFSVLKSLGVVVEEEPDDTWDEKEPVYIIDVEDFLKAVAAGQEYWEDVEGSDEKIQILEPTPIGIRLLENIDFHYEYYRIFEDGYIPNLSNTFDGNYHYIYNLASPLFNENHGNITNLGLRNIITEEIESNENFEVGGATFDTSYTGLIACINYGTVKNMRIVKADMKVRVRTSDPYEPTQEAHNAALLFGVNRGSVYNIMLADELNLTLENAEGETVMPNVLTGALAAQNLGLISGVSSIEDGKLPAPVISIINRCKGDNGVYIMGGATGNNPGNLSDIFIASVRVDSSESVGVESRLGGIAGEIPMSNSGSPEISGCIVRGSVTAGKVNSLTNVNSLTYTGGVAGSMNIQAVIYNTSVSMAVTGSPYTDSNVTYATGGAFGRIENTEGAIEGNVEKLAAFGPELWGISTYIGNFAGIAPRGFGWDHYEGKDINVRQVAPSNVGMEK